MHASLMPEFTKSLRPKLFVASSTRTMGVAKAIADRLQPHLDANVWSDGSFFAGNMTLDALHSVVRKNEFAVCVFGGSEGLNPNVLIELGMFLSVNGAGRTFIVLWGSNHGVPSDLAGVTSIQIPNSVVNEHEAASTAASQIWDAICNLWESGGIKSSGTAWHEFTTHPAADTLNSKRYARARRVYYEIPEAIVIQGGGFVTFRANFTIFNYPMPVKGGFFGRGAKHRDVAHMHYIGRDPEGQIEFHGAMLAFIPDFTAVRGLFLSRDEIDDHGLNVTVGGFYLERDHPEKTKANAAKAQSRSRKARTAEQ